MRQQAKLKLYLDVDDTVLASSEAVISILNHKYQLNKTIADLKDWGYRSIYKSVSPFEINSIYNSDEFFNQVQIIPSFMKGYQKIKQQLEICFVTKGLPLNLTKKEKLLNKLFPEAKMIGCCLLEDFTYDKSHVDMKGGIQIGDRPDELQTNAFLKVLYRPYERSYNKTSINQENLYVISSWEEIWECLNYFILNPEALKLVQNG